MTSNEKVEKMKLRHAIVIVFSNHPSNFLLLKTQMGLYLLQKEFTKHSKENVLYFAVTVTTKKLHYER